MFYQDAARQDYEDAENARYDRQLILQAEHFDCYAGDGEYVENPYAAQLAAREVVADWGGEADECTACGNLGYTIEINDEGVEYIDGCFDCFVAAHETEAA